MKKIKWDFVLKIVVEQQFVTDEWLADVYDLVKSIWSALNARKFNILCAAPSKKSYVYYFTFKPADKNGDLWDETLDLQIELREHRSDTHVDEGYVSENLIVKTYYLNGKTYRGMIDLLREIWKILDQLQEGDFSAFQ